MKNLKYLIFEILRDLENFYLSKEIENDDD